MSWLNVLREAIDRNLKPDEWYFRYIYMWQQDSDLAEFCFHSPLPELASWLFRTDKVNQVNLLYDQIYV